MTAPEQDPAAADITDPVEQVRQLTAEVDRLRTDLALTTDRLGEILCEAGAPLPDTADEALGQIRHMLAAGTWLIAEARRERDAADEHYAQVKAHFMRRCDNLTAARDRERASRQDWAADSDTTQAVLHALVRSVVAVAGVEAAGQVLDGWAADVMLHADPEVAARFIWDARTVALTEATAGGRALHPPQVRKPGPLDNLLAAEAAKLAPSSKRLPSRTSLDEVQT